MMIPTLEKRGDYFMSEDAKKNLELVISEIQIFFLKPRNGHLGFASFVLNHQIFVGNIAIYSRPDGSGLRLIFPTKRLSNNEEIPLVHPITRDAGEKIEKAVWEVFEEVVRGRGEQEGSRNASSR